jgi:hypothetical protein
MEMKLQWQVEKVTQIEPLYILGYTSNLGRVKKEASNYAEISTAAGGKWVESFMLIFTFNP